METIENNTIIGIAAISCWELSMLVAKNRIELSMDVQIWMSLAFQHPKAQLLPLSPEIAVLSTRLPGEFHGDPADRLIVASCLLHKVPLISKDEKIKRWGYLYHVRIISDKKPSPFKPFFSFCLLPSAFFPPKCKYSTGHDITCHLVNQSILCLLSSRPLFLAPRNNECKSSNRAIAS
nr:type II toxin-antitoxin system VapC family toxin [Okeania sp. SIO3B5]